MTSTTHPLVEAFHAVFDIKDATDDSNIRYEAYETIQHIETLMMHLGINVPRRFDGEGRT